MLSGFYAENVGESAGVIIPGSYLNVPTGNYKQTQEKGTLEI